MKIYVIECFLLILTIQQNINVKSLNILGIFPYQGKSYVFFLCFCTLLTTFYVFAPYLRALVEKGHNLTVISYFPRDKPIKNYHDISLDGKSMMFENIIPIYQAPAIFSILFTPGMAYSAVDNCKKMLEDEEVQELWTAKRKFDLVVVEQFMGDCSLGLAHKLNAPVVGLTSHVLMPQHYNRFGISFNPSYMPGLFLDVSNEPSLTERIGRTLFHYYFNFIYNQIVHRFENKALMEYFNDLPPLEELTRNIKFLLVYNNFILTGSNILPSNIIEVGGYHVAESRPLQGDLLKFIEESKHGVIYISFGSLLRGASLPKDKLQAIIDTLAELPQRVVWKWETKSIPGKPKNIMVSKWLPQNDLLAHPNVVAFISHCGNLGVTEAVYHGVPIIGMPMLGDQPANAAAVERSGFGVKILLSEITKEKLSHKLMTVLDPKFRANVKLLSRAWHDRPASAMAGAIHWTEFAAKYHNITFRAAAADVPLYQYLCLDIFLALLAPFLIFFIAVYGTLEYCFKSKSRNSKTLTKEKKSN